MYGTSIYHVLYIYNVPLSVFRKLQVSLSIWGLRIWPVDQAVGPRWLYHLVPQTCVCVRREGGREGERGEQEGKSGYQTYCSYHMILTLISHKGEREEGGREEVKLAIRHRCTWKIICIAH